MPFLFATPTIECTTPLMVAGKSVGVAPKSLSLVCSDVGTCQELINDKSDARSLTSATAYGSAVEHEPGLPVAKKIVPSVWLIVGELHNPAPTQPLGTILKVCWITPVEAFN